MTVSELMEQLATLDPDAEVMCQDSAVRHRGRHITSVATVRFTPEFTEVFGVTRQSYVSPQLGTATGVLLR